MVAWLADRQRAVPFPWSFDGRWSPGVNILMVLSTQRYPPDRRVEREARDLIRAGHNVFLIARRAPGQVAEETVAGVHVIRVPLPFQNRRLLCDLTYYLCQRYLILWSILRACRQHRIDALHVHDLPYAFATTLAGRLLHLPVVFDMHEHYTVMVAMGFEAPAYRRFKPLARPPLALLRLEERFACRRARKVIVVADEHVPRVVSLGVRKEDVVVVTNTEDHDAFSGLAIDQELCARYRDEFVILYIGMLNPHRGLETAIDAMPTILGRIPDARLLIVGDGPSRGVLEQRVRAARLEAYVTFAGYQPFARLPSYITLSAAGLIPHISTPHIETTMPNKIFQYMLLGRPVVVSSVRPLVRVVRDAQCGVVFTERDPRSLADAVLQLGDPRLRQRYGENGRAAVASRYRWSQTVQVLLGLYRQLASARRGRLARSRPNWARAPQQKDA
jgi:glycosyltransferase involved in cell wall biosynthesis